MTEPTRLGFCGTMKGMTDAQREAFAGFLRTLTVSEFRTGGLKGADEQATELVCRNTTARVVVHHVPGTGARLRSPHVRAVAAEVVRPTSRKEAAYSKPLVDAVDLLIVAPKSRDDDHGGTLRAFQYARRSGKPVVILWPDGATETRTHERARACAV